ncbi:LUD domain-containing protein [Nonomuraea jabiensis]|uniref:LUD domain-containing protein n=1 Tax=Nonomuraea jabiensis TaxID=882448 RepID=UPI003443ACF8
MQAVLRLGTTAEYVVGSEHAVTEEGHLVIASASGSRRAPYASGARKGVWVAGAQKVVPDLETALRRVRSYSLPREHQRLQEFGQSSFIGKILIVEREPCRSGPRSCWYGSRSAADPARAPRPGPGRSADPGHRPADGLGVAEEVTQAAEHAGLRLGRGGAEVVIGEVGAAVADEPATPDFDAPDPAASLGGDVGVQLDRLGGGETGRL